MEEGSPDGPGGGGAPGGPLLTRVRGGLESFLEWVVLGLTLSLALVVVVGVSFRKGGAALVWYDEVASILLAWLTYYGASLAALKRAHIGFPTVMARLPQRVRIPLLVVAELVVVAFFVLVAWAGWQVLLVLEGASLTSLSWVPRRLTQSVIPVGAALYVAAQLLSLPEHLARPPREEEHGLAFVKALAHPPGGKGEGTGSAGEESGAEGRGPASAKGRGPASAEGQGPASAEGQGPTSAEGQGPAPPDGESTGGSGRGNDEEGRSP